MGAAAAAVLSLRSVRFVARFMCTFVAFASTCVAGARTFVSIIHTIVSITRTFFFGIRTVVSITRTLATGMRVRMHPPYSHRPAQSP